MLDKLPKVSAKDPWHNEAKILPPLHNELRGKKRTIAKTDASCRMGHLICPECDGGSIRRECEFINMG